MGSLVLILGYTNCSGGFDTQGSNGGNSGAGVNLPAGLPSLSNQALPAVAGTPLVHQIRNGVEVRTYSSLGAAFTRTPGFRLYETGDIYELDPAIYSGQANQAWVGPLAKDDAEYSRGFANFQAPKNITIRGRTVNGYRPVIRVDSGGVGSNTLGQGVLYLDRSENITIENIDFDGGGTSVPSSGKSGIYLNGAKGFTLRDSRVLNFNQSNGVFSTGANAGIFLFENVETGYNGGDSGPEHNYYIASSDVDANHIAVWRGCYSHDVYYGHTLKSRAQNNLVEASYFKGKKVSGNNQGETYLADFPNGGNIVVRNNIFEKDFSGDNSNGVFVTYAMEGQKFANASSISITHNTFIARSKVYDNASHYLSPMAFFYPSQIPTAAGFPVANARVKGNLFAGFETSVNLVGPTQLYRGEDFLELANLGEISAGFELTVKKAAQLNAVGELAPVLGTGSKLRATSNFGALD